MTPLMAGYTAVTHQRDPKGDYLCGSCNMFITGPGGRGACTAIRPSRGEGETDYISGPKGGCNFYMKGPPASVSNINPNRLTKSAGGYVEDGPFSCKRCINFLGESKDGCIRVVAHGTDGVARIKSDECCNGWQPRGDFTHGDFEHRIMQKMG